MKLVRIYGVAGIFELGAESVNKLNLIVLDSRLTGMVGMDFGWIPIRHPKWVATLIYLQYTISKRLILNV